MAVWDDLRKGAESLWDEGAKLPRYARLAARIKALENALGEKIYDLGSRALELHRRNELHHTELEELFVEIRALQREIRDRQDDLQALKATGRSGAGAAAAARCPDCGGAVTDSDRFCRQCGYDLKGL